MRKLMPLLPLVLCGCAAFDETYVPQPLEITDAAQYQADAKLCHDAAANKFKPQLHAGEIVYQTAHGAAQNGVGALAGGVVVPIAGAAGGGSTAIIDGLDAMGHARANVERHCLDEKTHRDRSAILANPND